MMNKKELELAAELLENASDAFSNHGCNDVNDKIYIGWTLEERQKLVQEFYEWNGDPEEYDPTFLHLSDFMLMSFLADKLKEQANDPFPEIPSKSAKELIDSPIFFKSDRGMGAIEDE